VNIRPVTAADTEAIIEFWCTVLPEYSDAQKPQREPRANIARKLAAKDGLFWIAEVEGRIAGTVMAGYDGHRGWIYTLAVAHRCRRQGVASALIRHAESALTALGCPKVNLQVLAANEDARQFYGRLGYVPDEVVSLGKRLT
jgi:ribosomal protein S18 acetylase RimI-like enzyme